MIARAAFVAMLLLALPAWAADGESTAVSLRQDGSLALADGRTLCLSEIEIAGGRHGREAHDALATLIGAGPLTLQNDGPSDRFGCVNALAWTADGTWVQKELLRQGLARVITTPEHKSEAHGLLAVERQARSHHMGLWADSRYSLRAPDELRHLLDSWQIVEGTVTSVEARHGGAAIFFGEDRANGLEVRVSASIAKDLEFDPTAMTGRKLRVRGWIGKATGPLIIISHAEQIETIGRLPASAKRDARDEDG